MGRNCEICGRGTAFGNNVPRKGLVKKKGGTGSKIGVKSKRTFKVNIQTKFLTINNSRKKVRVCTRCLRTLEKVPS